MLPEEKTKEIKIIGEEVINLYSKCWERANDCFKRHYKPTTKDDKQKIINMTESMFIHILSLINPIQNSNIFNEDE